jgi:hypothetical protein
MATENGWHARKIQAELSKLEIHLGLTTISRYLTKVGASGNPHQRWMTFLRNQEAKPSGRAKVIRLPRVGGLHGRYTWRDAA